MDGSVASALAGGGGGAAVFMILPGAQLDILLSCSKQTRSRLPVGGAWRRGMVGLQVVATVKLAS